MFPARRSGYRSPGSPQPRPLWQGNAGTPRCDSASGRRAAERARRCGRCRSADENSHPAIAFGTDCLYGADPDAAGAADQSRSGCGPAGWPVSAAEPTRPVIFARAARGSVISGVASSGSGRSAENAILSQRPGQSALSARSARCQPRRPALPRDTATAEPAGFTLAAARSVVVEAHPAGCRGPQGGVAGLQLPAFAHRLDSQQRQTEPVAR